MKYRNWAFKNGCSWNLILIQNETEMLQVWEQERLSRIKWKVYEAEEQKMDDHLQSDLVWDLLIPHNARPSATNAALNELSKYCLSSRLLGSRILCLMSEKTDIDLVDKENSTWLLSKQLHMDVIISIHVSQSMRSLLDAKRSEMLRRKPKIVALPTFTESTKSGRKTTTNRIDVV